MSKIEWTGRATFSPTGASARGTTLSVAGGRVSADPPTVPARKAAWNVEMAEPRVTRGAFRFNVDAKRVNDALEAGRGRGLVVDSLADDGGLCCALAWHLPEDPREPPLVTTLGVRHVSDHADERIGLLVDGGVAVAFDLLLWMAEQYRDWVLSRLAAKEAVRLPPVQVAVAVEGRPDLLAYLEDLFRGRVKVLEKPGSEIRTIGISR